MPDDDGLPTNPEELGPRTGSAAEASESEASATSRLRLVVSELSRRARSAPPAEAPLLVAQSKEGRSLIRTLTANSQLGTYLSGLRCCSGKWQTTASPPYHGWCGPDTEMVTC